MPRTQFTEIINEYFVLACQRFDRNMPKKKIRRLFLDFLTFPARERNAISKSMAIYCENFLIRYENIDWQAQTNGERLLLQRLSMLPECVAFDVGAHFGGWTDIALGFLRDPTIHAFEVAPVTAEMLSQRFGRHDNVRVNFMGLGEAEGTVNVAYFPDHADNSRIVPEKGGCASGAQVLSAYLTTGDSYCRSNDVERIDLLKIDVEGHELPVLRGFSELLQKKLIGVVQFEYVADFMIRNERCLEDVFELLIGFGYRIGRLLPKGVIEERYDTRLERLVFANFVAVARERDDLWRAIAYRR